MTFVPNRAAGLAALDAFIDRAGRDYADTRNFDHGPADRTNVSQLSPYLRYRLITEDEVVAAGRARHRGSAADKYVQEVLWRTYWKGWLELRPSVWADYVAEVARLEDQSGGWRRDYDRAVAGHTGIDCFDAWIGELVEYGYLHNHARMWFASIWIFTLRLPWQLGAALFARHLFDGDPASNTLSWRWVAGLQTAGKTYLAQADNIARFTDGRFSPSGLATKAVAITAPATPSPKPLVELDPPVFGRVALLLTEDDLAPETLPLDGVEIVAVASLSQDHGRAPAVERFVGDALSDARRRAASRFGVAGVDVTDTTTADVENWANSEGLGSIITAYAPVGPGARALAALTDGLRGRGIAVTRIRRSWDEDAWPHATRGFFAFREHYAG